MRAYGDKRVGRDPVELIVLMGVLSILLSWIVKYVWCTYGYPYATIAIVAVWCVLVGGLLFRRGLRHAWLDIGQYVSPIAVLTLFYNMVTPKLFLMLGGG